MNLENINKNVDDFNNFLKELLQNDNIVINISMDDKSDDYCLIIINMPAQNINKVIKTSVKRENSFVLANKIIYKLLEEKGTDENIFYTKMYETRYNKSDYYGLNIYNTSNSLVRIYLDKNLRDLDETVSYFNNIVDEVIKTK